MTAEATPAGWIRIVSWAKKNAPAMLENLSEGASDAQLAALEGKLGRVVPAALKAILRQHNGETGGWPTLFGPYGDFHSTQAIANAWQQRLEIAKDLKRPGDPDPVQLVRDGIIHVEGPVRLDNFRREWIPIMDFNGDIFWALDFAPADGGTPGQVIEIDWEACSSKVIAPSFEAFLEGYAAALEAGEFPLVEGVPRGEGY
jgi:cell wall assembly regulator SMI1